MNRVQSLFTFTLLSFAGCSAPPEMDHIRLVSSTMLPSATGESSWDIDTGTNPVLVTVAVASEVYSLENAPQAYYWVDGKEVFAGNDIAQKLSPQLPMLDREIGEVKYKQLVIDAMQSIPNGKLRWHIMTEMEPIHVTLMIESPPGQFKAAGYLVEGATVYTADEEAARYAPTLAPWDWNKPMRVK